MTVNWQLEPAATDRPAQPETTAKSAVVDVTVEMFNGALPVLYTVTACKLLGVPTPWLAKTRLFGDRVAIGKGVTPVPDNVIVRGLPTPLSVTVTEPLRVPVAVGLKVIDMAQLLPVYRVVLVQPPTAKSPLGVTDEVVIGVLPWFTRYTTVAGLVVLSG